MRLGHIQKSVVSFLLRCGEGGGFIGSTTKAEEFRGLDLEQVQSALTGLQRRGLIKREGIRYVLTEKWGANASKEGEPELF